MKKSGWLLLGAVLAARVAVAAPRPDLRLAYVSQSLGEVEPCG